MSHSEALVGAAAPKPPSSSRRYDKAYATSEFRGDAQITAPLMTYINDKAECATKDLAKWTTKDHGGARTVFAHDAF